MRYLPWYAFSLPTKRRRPFGEKHAAFYPKARLLFEKAGGLLKFAARAFFKSWRPFQFTLPSGLFQLLVLEHGDNDAYSMHNVFPSI
ncbi:MAG: hypothetical protein MJZ97_01700 [Bacteroidales bacterium]|nr:hypothetical protein [Bacteroidales bacterium]